MKNIFNYVKQTDWSLVSAVILLSAFGFMVTASMAQAGGGERFTKHLIFLAAGLICFFALGRLSASQVQAFALPMYAACLGLMAAVLVFGTTVRATRGWFALGPLSVQPVEFMKLGMVMMLASWFAKTRLIVPAMRRIWSAGAIAAAPVVLTLLQPDFGSALIVMLIGIAMIAFELPGKAMAVWGGIVVTAGILALLIFLPGSQRQRLITLVNPRADPFGAGYNVRQSLIAIGSGGLFGRGIGAGSQGHLRFLPEAATDFPFAIIAEELGLAGALILLGLYGLVIGRMMVIINRARDDFALYLVLGIMAWFTAQTSINIGMNLGLLPVIGVPLPFISYGGSALIAAFSAMGLVLGVSSTLHRTHH